MMCKGSTLLWNVFGAASILTIALLNSSCCAHRKAVTESRTEQTEQVRTTAQSETMSEGTQEAILSRELEKLGTTVTEIEIYDTDKPADPTTGERPLKARIRQKHGEETTDRTKAESHATEQTKQQAQADQVYDGGNLAEVTVTAEKPPNLWNRIKQGAAWAVVIVILAAAGWIIYKLKKR